MRVLSIAALLLVLATPVLAYTVLWDRENTIDQVGYMYTQFQSFGTDAEYWAPQHNAGADLDGDGVIEFVSFMGGNEMDAYVTDSRTGNIEYTYSWPLVANERVMVVVYFDALPGDGVQEVLVQTLYRTFVISGGSAGAVPSPVNSDRSTLLLQPSVPNPFNDHATLRFQLADAGLARISIYDATGRLVQSVFDGALPAGGHTVNWDGRNEQGARAASGVYHARLEVGPEIQTRKIVLVR